MIFCLALNKEGTVQEHMIRNLLMGMEIAP